MARRDLCEAAGETAERRRPRSARAGWTAPAYWIAASALFALAYTQYPLFSRTYNTYMLHGLALAGEGQLAGDWMAGTTDPFVIFSALVALVQRTAGPWLFYALHAALLGVYLGALVLIAEALMGCPAGARPHGGPWRRATLTLLVGLPSSWLFRQGVVLATGGDWGWYVHGGVAMQFVVNPMLLPSMFGTLCLASIAAHCRRRPRLAILLAGGAALIHASYLITSAALIAAYCAQRWRDERAFPGRLVLVGVVALAVPVGLAAWRFWPTDGATLDEAQQIIAQLRIPHHAQIGRWLHRSLLIQGPLLLVGLLCCWRSAVRTPYLVCLLAAGGLTAVQAAVGSDALALLFPWRSSVILVPLATAAAVAWVYRLALAFPGRRAAWLRWPGRALVVGLALGAALFGLNTTRRYVADHARDAALPMMRWVRAHAGSADLYVIPPGMQRFRLEAAARTFVDWKSHPYRDVEVLQWYRRNVQARRLFRELQEGGCASLCALAREYGATHVAGPTAAVLAASCPALSGRYEDGAFAVAQIRCGP